MWSGLDFPTKKPLTKIFKSKSNMNNTDSIFDSVTCANRKKK